LKITIEPIGNNRGLVDRVGKGGSSIYSFRKSADFYSEEKSAGVVSVYEQKRLADSVYLRLKWLIEVGILRVQCFKDRTRKDLADWI
jgi:hypothetical protein